MFVGWVEPAGTRAARSLLLITAGVGAALAAAFFGGMYLTHRGGLRAATADICGDRPGAGLVGAGLPWGIVSGCEVLDRSAYAYPFDGREASATVLLTTNRGLVAIRIDYSNLNDGRQMRCDAVEVAADDVPGLPGATERQLAGDIAGRGGLRQQEWALCGWDG
jgi:hypothetical protein